MSETNPFNARLVYGLIAAGVAAFAALILLLAYAEPPLRQARVNRAQMLSNSAVGYRALAELVGRFHSAYTITSANDLDYDDLFVMAVTESTRPQDVAWVRERRATRATLIILPKWVTARHPRRQDWVTIVAPGAGDALARALGFRLRIAARGVPGEVAHGGGMLEGMVMPIPAYPQVIDGPALTPLVSLPGGGAMVARIGDQPHYVVADPDLLNNHGLGDPQVARAALALIESLNAPDAASVNFGNFDDEVDAVIARRPSLIRLAVEPPFLAMTLALFVAALLAGLHGAVRFGQPRREERAIALGKAALVENSAGLIKLARREARLGAAYADVVRQDAARAVGAPAALSGDELNAYLDRLSKGDDPKFTALVTRIVWARDRHELVAAARALFSWKKDIIR
jgi:hypothetical protein